MHYYCYILPSNTAKSGLITLPATFFIRWLFIGTNTNTYHTRRRLSIKGDTFLPPHKIRFRATATIAADAVYH